MELSREQKPRPWKKPEYFLFVFKCVRFEAERPRGVPFVTGPVIREMVPASGEAAAAGDIGLEQKGSYRRVRSMSSSTPGPCVRAADTAMPWGRGGRGACTHPALCPGGHHRLSTYRDAAHTSPRKPSWLCLSPNPPALPALCTGRALRSLYVSRWHALACSQTVSSWRDHRVAFICFPVSSTVHDTRQTLRTWWFGHSRN